MTTIDHPSIQRLAAEVRASGITIRNSSPGFGVAPEVIAATPAITVGIALAGAVYGAYMAGRAFG